MAKITHIKINNSSTLYDLGGGGMVFDGTVTLKEIYDFYTQGLVIIIDGNYTWIVRNAQVIEGDPNNSYNITVESIDGDYDFGTFTILYMYSGETSGLRTFSETNWTKKVLGLGAPGLGRLGLYAGYYESDVLIPTLLQVSVPESPVANTDAASKKYVDDKIAALQSTLSSLQTTVNGKANQTDLTSLTNTVNNKADKSTVTTLQNTVNGHTTSINTLNSQNSKYSSMWQTIYNG